jgi:hypothetical protein
VKPEIHQDEAVGVTSDSAFRLFIGLITLADDYGRLKGGLGLLNSQVWPYAPKSLDEVDQLLDELASARLVQRYEVAGKPYVCLPSWEHHQRIDNAGKTRIPPPDPSTRGDSPRTSANLGESPLEGKGEEGKGSRKGVGGESAADAASPTATVEKVLALLEQVAFGRNESSPSVEKTAALCKQFAQLDLPAQAEKFAHYWTGPRAKAAMPGSEVLWAFRVWLETDNGKTPKVTKAPTGKRDRSRYDAMVETAT